MHASEVHHLFCCAYANRQDIKLGLSLDDQTWDISNNVIQDTFDHVAQSGVLDTLWLQRIGEPVLLTAKQIADTQAAHLFATSGTIPITTYGHENSLKVLNDVSLWDWCTSRVTGFFASMPLTGKATNVNEGRDQDESIPHVSYADYLYNPDTATDMDSAPSRDHDQARLHSMELLIDKLLRRSRELVPHSTSGHTHAHRYIASDSVWCENTEDMHVHQATAQTTTVPASLHTHELQQHSVVAPDLQNIMYAADVLRRCPCGWSNSDKCFIPDAVCKHGANVIKHDSRLANGTLTKLAWSTLCAAPYKSRTDIVAVLQVLAELNGPILSNCSARNLTTLWGLLAADQPDAWYAGDIGTDQRTGTWSFGTQHLASAGPGGLSLGMLSPHAPISM